MRALTRSPPAGRGSARPAEELADPLSAADHEPPSAASMAAWVALTTWEAS
jgi:hypothetical protein